jgi:serine/threonine-protein kinase
MFTMLAGAPPFRGNQAEILEQHLNQAPAPLRQVRADIPPPLEALVAQLLAKSPAARPADATEVREWLAGMMLDPSDAVVSMPARGRIPVPNTAIPRKIRPAGRAPAPTDDVQTSTRRHPARRVRSIIAAAALAVALALTATVVARAVADRPQPRGVSDAPATASPPTTTSVTALAQTQAAVQPSTPIQPSRPTTAPTTVPASSQAPVDPIAAIRMSIQRLVSTGNLNPDKASDLNNNVDAIAHALAQGNAGDVTNSIKAMRDKLTALRTGGLLTASGYDELNRDLNAIAAQA